MVRLIYSTSVYGESVRPYETGKGHSKEAGYCSDIYLNKIPIFASFLVQQKPVNIMDLVYQRGVRDRTEPKSNITKSKTNKQHKVTDHNKKNSGTNIATWQYKQKVMKQIFGHR